MILTVPFREIVTRYKIVFFDAYGVLKNYKGLIPGIKDTIKFLKQKDIEFYVLTNDASRSPAELALGYAAHGIPEITEQKMISSGMIAQEYLSHKVKDGIVTYLGTPQSTHYIKSAGLETVSLHDLQPEQLHQVSALVLLDDEGFEWQRDINLAINLIRRFNVPVIVANTDRSYPVSNNEVAVAVGSLANMIERIVSKSFIRFGKPDSQMFNFAFQHVLKDHDIQKEDILMVGDTLKTDILGGNKFGISTALVLTGNTQANKAEPLIETSGIIPNYICESAVIRHSL